MYKISGKNEEQLPKKLLADCRLPPFTKIFCQQLADRWQKIFVKGGKRQSANSYLLKVQI